MNSRQQPIQRRFIYLNGGVQQASERIQSVALIEEARSIMNPIDLDPLGL
jgi:hypothetical protein